MKTRRCDRSHEMIWISNLGTSFPFPILVVGLIIDVHCSLYQNKMSFECIFYLHIILIPAQMLHQSTLVPKLNFNFESWYPH